MTLKLNLRLFCSYEREYRNNAQTWRCQVSGLASHVSSRIWTIRKTVHDTRQGRFNTQHGYTRFIKML
jgi:hypothetical protein